MKIEKKVFGVTKQGEEVSKYTLENENGMKVSLSDLGCVITNIWVPDKNGVFDDVVLGFDTVAEYEQNAPAFGAVVGRVANRIGNASFSLNGKTYHLDQNDKTNCLHGGFTRLERTMYQAECENKEDCASVSFSRMSQSDEQGFPGDMLITVTYTLNEDNALLVEYHAVCDEDTVVNLTNHSYFNLGAGGHKSGTVLDHNLQIFAESYTPVDELLLPTGEICPVKGTALDFRMPHKIGERIGKESEGDVTVDGYDHNFVLPAHEIGDAILSVSYSCEKTGRKMEVYTDFPGLQVYSSTGLKPTAGKDSAQYQRFGGICFETQNFPNAVNTPNFPSALLPAGEEYDRIAVFSFGLLD